MRESSRKNHQKQNAEIKTIPHYKDKIKKIPMILKVLVSTALT